MIYCPTVHLFSLNCNNDIKLLYIYINFFRLFIDFEHSLTCSLHLPHIYILDGTSLYSAEEKLRLNTLPLFAMPPLLYNFYCITFTVQLLIYHFYNLSQIYNEVPDMIVFMKSYSLFTIKMKLIILYLLNILDIIFTLLLLSTGLFMEMNGLLVNHLDNPIKVMILKVFLPAFILLYLYLRIQKATQKQLIHSNIVINLAASLYTLINISHIIWIILIPFLNTWM